MAAHALITGASGLVGSWVLHHWGGTGTTPLPVRHSDVDLLVPGAAADLVARTEPTQVVHLAWSASGRADYRSTDDNDRWVDATLELVEAARAAGAGVWLTGTAVDDEADARDAYARSKARLRTSLAVRHRRRARWAGCAPTTSSTSSADDRRWSTWRRAPGSGARPLHLRSPHQAHDFVHASDVGRAIVTAVAHDLMGEVQIGSGRLHTVAELVTRLGAGWSADPDPGAPAPTHTDQTADTTRLTRSGWAPTRTEELFDHG